MLTGAHSRLAMLLDFAIFLLVPLLLALQHFTSYVELTPSSLEYRALCGIVPSFIAR